MPGSSRGTLRPEIAAELGIDYPVEVIAVGSHDTASAIHALPPVKRPGCRRAFLSSGTWSLLGIELDRFELYKIETCKKSVKDFELIALCVVLDIDFDELKKLIENY